MIRIIAEATESGYGNSFEETLTYEQQLMAKQVAGVVLQAIEEAGMLPPQVGDYNVAQIILDAETDDATCVHYWEPEDEN